MAESRKGEDGEVGVVRRGEVGGGGGGEVGRGEHKQEDNVNPESAVKLCQLASLHPSAPLSLSAHTFPLSRNTFLFFSSQTVSAPPEADMKQSCNAGMQRAPTECSPLSRSTSTSLARNARIHLPAGRRRRHPGRRT